jgi:putative transposase
LKRESVKKETDMRQSRFSEEKIIAILAEQERGMGTVEVCRKHGNSSATFYIYGLRPRGKKVVIVV